MRTLIALLALVAALAVAPAASADYGLLRTFGAPGDGPGQLDNPIGVAVGPDGHVFVADGKNDRVLEWLPDGTFVRGLGRSGTGRGELRLPEDVLVDGDTLYVTDCYNAHVTAFSLTTGRFTGVWGGVRSGEPELSCPESLAMQGGRLFVADTFDQRVVSFVPGGAVPGWQTFGTAGTGPGQFTQVHAIETDQDGNLLVGDEDPHSCSTARILRFSPAGDFLGQFGSFTGGTGAGQLFCIWDIERDAAGNVLVSDAAARIYAFAPDGTLLRQVNAASDLRFVIGLDSNAACELFAVDRDNSRIAVFGWPDAPTCRAITPVSPPPPPLPQPPLPDATAPVVRLYAARVTPFGGPVRLGVKCSEDCVARITVSARLRGTTRRVLATGTLDLTANVRHTTALRLGRSANAAIRRYLRTHRSLRLSLRADVVDGSGNRTTKFQDTSLRRQT